MSDPKRAKRDDPTDGATLAEADGLGKLNAWTGKPYSDRFYAIYKVGRLLFHPSAVSIAFFLDWEGG